MPESHSDIGLPSQEMTSAGEPKIAASVRLIVWCRECQRHVEPVEIAEPLVCSKCGSRQVDRVSGTERR